MLLSFVSSCKLVTKITASHKIQHITSPYATSLSFWKACLFTSYPNISTTIRGLQFHASQTKIFEGRTKDWVCLFEALFKGVSAIFRRRTIEKVLRKDSPCLCSAFQNLLLGGINFREFLVYNFREFACKVYAPQTKILDGRTKKLFKYSRRRIFKDG